MPGFVKVSVQSYRDQGLDFMGLLAPHLAGAGEVIKQYMVTFIANEEPLGSGTIIETCGVEGILTANHVAEELFKFPEFSPSRSERPVAVAGPSSSRSSRICMRRGWASPRRLRASIFLGGGLPSDDVSGASAMLPTILCKVSSA